MEPCLTTESPIRAAETTFTRLLVPVDFSAGSRRALGAALVLRRSLGSEVHLFNLAELGGNDEYLAGTGANPVTPEELVEDTKARLLRFVDNVFPGHSREVTVHARMGVDVVHGIERIAKEIGATLVLLGARQRESFFRTDIEKVVRDLNGAVMLFWVAEDVAAS
ncbi:MAG: universal stress protein [Polyangiaceae bacterium]